MRDKQEQRTKVDGLEEARVTLEHMLNGNAVERTAGDVARVIVEKVAKLLAEWEELPYAERRTNQINGLGNPGPEIVVREPRYDFAKTYSEVLRRWEHRDPTRSKLGPQGLAALDDRRTLDFLRDVLLAFGLPGPDVSGRLAKLPLSATADNKRLRACGYWDFFVQFCVHGRDPVTGTKLEVTDKKLIATYRMVHAALRDAGIATDPALTETAFFLEIGKTIEMVDDPAAPTRQRPRQLEHPKLTSKHESAPSGEPLRMHARRGLGLRSDEEIAKLLASIRATTRPPPPTN